MTLLWEQTRSKERRCVQVCQKMSYWVQQSLTVWAHLSTGRTHSHTHLWETTSHSRSCCQHLKHANSHLPHNAKIVWMFRLQICAFYVRRMGCRHVHLHIKTVLRMLLLLMFRIQLCKLISNWGVLINKHKLWAPALYTIPQRTYRRFPHMEGVTGLLCVS